ncbi:LysR family transcriptional regulator [Sneathiella glossodoripedis]|uniref:LysR family transcriptional regulator n=1 Tax=Sneathiella glossodoripedis TaxID=418853 RepID=UPI00046E5B37|nr:LysR family transcriptional regulator [Sneathiella glossodoripedis]
MDRLESDLLRTFVEVAKAGSITEGAERIGRSQSATSLQIKRLEEILGSPVFYRHGRGIVLSETGRLLLPVANDVTDRLERTVRDLTSRKIEGKLRLGIPDDHGRARLVRILAAFSERHPLVELEVTCALSADFPDALKKGRLDLAIYEVSAPSEHEELLFEDPTEWVTLAGRDFAKIEILPIALFDHACWWREAALKSLDQSGRPYRIVYSSQSVSGITAAVEAGIAIGLLGCSSLNRGLARLDRNIGLGPTPTSKLVMAENTSAPQDPLITLKSAIREAFSAIDT